MAEEKYSQDEGKLDPKTDHYIQELLQEKHSMDGSKNPHAARLLQDEMNRVLECGRGRPEQRYVDIFHDKPTKVVTKVTVPVKEHPRFNFVGKLLGPKGNTLKRLQEETQCRMSVLGRGSMKDKAKEEELRTGLDPKFAHLSEELHVEISALAPPAEAHARVAYALAEVRKYLIPDSNDDIAAQQAREMEHFDPDAGLGLDGEADNGYGNPVARPLRGGRGGFRGSSFSPGSYGSSGNYGGALSSTPGRGGRGGVLRGGRGRGASVTGHMTKPYDRFENDASDGAYSTTNQSYGATLYEGVQRRPVAPASQQYDDNTHGRWKQRGGGSRFMERSLPYTRRT